MSDLQSIKDIVFNLCSLPGQSGYETPVADEVVKLWKGLTDEIRLSRLGNVYALKKANVPMKGKRRSILFAAHMDAVGMIATELVGEFIRFEQIGGLDPRILPGQFVNIHTRQGAVKGLIAMPTKSLTKKDYGKDPIPMDQLLIDTGYDAESLKKMVRPGDIISFASEPVSMQNDTCAGHTLDDRTSIAALTVCLQELQSVLHKWDVYAVGTVQEEETGAGALAAAYDNRPDIAVAIDVTHASSPFAKGWETFELGSGPVLGFGMNMHPKLYELFREICENENIPFSTEYSPEMSGTDAMDLQTALSGIPSMVISFPLRYMHTANELVALKDISNVGKLLAAIVRRLDEGTMDRLAWED